jgi:hypothetical protein
MSNKSKYKPPNKLQKVLQEMSPEERAALAEWARQYQKVQPELQRMAATAKEIHRRMVEAPQWSIVEGEPLPGAEKPSLPDDLWNTGGPTINYVDHIEPIANSDAPHGAPATERNGQ